MKKVLCITLAAILIFSLAACGGGGSSDASDPNQGLWSAVEVEMMGFTMDVSEVYEKGFTIELKSGGKCALNVDGAKANGTWSLNGSAFTVKGGGLDESGTLADGALTLSNVMGMGMDIRFKKEGGQPAASSGNASDDEKSDSAPSGSAEAGDLAKVLAWWEGDWYGSFYISDTNSGWSEMDGNFEDVYAVIKTNPNGAATVFLWTDEYELGTVDIMIDTAGGVGGSAVTTGGELFDYPLGRNSWNINTGEASYDNMIEILERFTDTDGDWFNYEIYLRPWGMLWDDVSYSDQPLYYDDWYLDVYKDPMLDVLMESDLPIHSGVKR